MMDDSDQDFSILCSRLLKRVKRKGDSGDEKKAALRVDGKKGEAPQTQSRCKSTWKRKREKKDAIKDEETRTDDAVVETVVERNQQQEVKGRAKDKVLSRMQRFKRASPPRLQHTESTESADNLAETSASLQSQADSLEKVESDEVLARRLQEQLDSKAESHAVVNLEDGGLFFCQLCYKDLSAMNHQLRTQHINRCLDKGESSGSGDAPLAHPPLPCPHPQVPACPICGRGFKSEKTRCAHLKRCSATMGVSPAELLQVLHRQAAESESKNAQRQTGGSSDTSDSSMPKRKKVRKRAPKLDEDTMVALALSRSLLEQKIESDREEERQRQFLSSSPPPVAASILQKKSAPVKGRGKRRKDLARPTPLLLIQDLQTAQIRIQERVSALLLCSRPPTPSTPTLQPSSLPAPPDSALLWIKSALPGEGPVSVDEFYTTELSPFIQPAPTSQKHESLSSEVTPVSKATSDPEQGLSTNLGIPGTQALLDLVDLAEEGMTLTQSGNDPAVVEPHLRGFVPGPDDAKSQIPSVNVSRLCSDLGTMINNPQLSDVQLQVDSGEVYFAHSFMLYTRCPLLASTVHDEGFRVQEEGLPQAQRLLLNDVSAEAVYALLQYLYTATCSLTHNLLADVIQLCTRFGLLELQQQCEQHLENSENLTEKRQDACPVQEPEVGPQQSLADTQFMELLRSMWEYKESDAKETRDTKVHTEGDDQACGGNPEMIEELVDEAELDEIYEFAATQRKKEKDEEADAETNNVEEKNSEEKIIDHIEVSQTLKSQSRGSGSDIDAKEEVDLVLDVSLDRSYNRLFSESWGEYVEPTQSQAQNKNMPVESHSSSSVSEVIDLSTSPPPGSGDADKQFFPLAGVSPGQTGETSDPNNDSNESKQFGNPVRSAGLTQACPKSPISRRTHLETVISVNRSSTKTPSSSLLPASFHTTQCQSELIVLSDSSDDMDIDLPPGPAQFSPKNNYTLIQDRTEVQSSTKRARNYTSYDQSTHSEVSAELNTSAEVSWLIPATPEPSACPRSWQTGTSMHPTQLFPKSSSLCSSKTVNRSQIQSLSNIELRPGSNCSVAGSLEAPPALQNILASSQSSFTREACSSTPVHPKPLLKNLDFLESPLHRFEELAPLQLSSADRSEGQKAHEGTSTSFALTNADQTKTEEPPRMEDCAGNSFCVFDDPPIPFDDSWGLGGALPEQPPCFSLKLDSSEDPTSPAQHRGSIESPTLPGLEDPVTPPHPAAQNDYADVWDSWDEGSDVASALPLSERLDPAPLARRVAQLKTPVACKKKNRVSLVPITPMPGFSDMDTPELKNRLNRYGVRPLPKKQMVLKLKEIHHYTHQLMSSGSEEETSPRARPKSALPKPSLLCFKQPTAPPPASPRKQLFNQEEQDAGLPASQDSNTSSTAESERSNPELCDSDSAGSDNEGVTASQAVVREKDKLQAVYSFIVSDPLLYGQVLRYQPLSLSELKASLRAAGIRLGTAKLLDFLDSKCITFSTAKSVPSRRKARVAGKGRKRATKAAG